MKTPATYSALQNSLGHMK